MAVDFLQKRGDVNPLGVNWIQKFLLRHPHLDSRWSQSIENDRLLYNRPENLADWFTFWQTVLDRYDFDVQDIYNMDEKGFAQGLLGALKVVCDRRQLATEKSRLRRYRLLDTRHLSIAHLRPPRKRWTVEPTNLEFVELKL